MNEINGMKRLVLGLAGLSLAACATVNPQSRVESQLLGIGMDANQAVCLANELGNNLDRGQMASLADFISGLSRSQSPGQALDALLSIDDPMAAAGVAKAGFSCAFDQAFGR